MPRLRATACLAALPTVMNKRESGERFQAYQAECLRVITENTAKYAGGSYMQSKWSSRMDEKPSDTRSGEEIVADLVAKGAIQIRPSSKR